MKFLGIIPARGGSKGLKNKNIFKINKKTLIEYTFDQLKGVKIDKIIVSSDSKKILKIAKKYKNLSLAIRPKKLATDKSLVINTIKYHIKKEQEKNFFYDYILLLSPTSPLRTKKQLLKAINIVKKKRPDSLVSVERLNKPLEWLLKLNKKGNLIEYMGNGKAIGNRQNKKTYFFPNGAIYIIKTNKVSANKYYFKKTIPFEMNFKTSLDIDSKEDIKKFKFYNKL